MLKNYFKIAMRIVRRHKGYSFIKISGLAIGMAVCILILLFIRYELSFDKFHEKKDRIYRVLSELELSQGTEIVSLSALPLAPALKDDYDAFVIGCYYDVALREAREVSGRAVVLAPCQSSLVYAAHLGTSFSVLVGRRKWIPKMEENIRQYGAFDRLVSMRSLELGVHDFQKDKDFTAQRMLDEGRRAIEEDGAELLILGCTIEFGFFRTMQQELGVPVIDAVLAPFKLAESLGDSALRFGWTPSRKWGSQTPPGREVEEWGIFKGELPIGNLLKG